MKNFLQEVIGISRPGKEKKTFIISNIGEDYNNYNIYLWL
jgi:hypothetical protein